MSARSTRLWTPRSQSWLSRRRQGTDGGSGTHGGSAREQPGQPGLFILDVSTGRLTEVARYTPLYQRYSGAVRLTRLYVRPDQAERAREMMGRLLGQTTTQP